MELPPTNWNRFRKPRVGSCTELVPMGHSPPGSAMRSVPSTAMRNLPISFPHVGGQQKPAFGLAMVLVRHSMENLTDRQAAQAV